MPEFAQLYTVAQAELDAGLYVLASMAALALAALCWVEAHMQGREDDQLRRVDDVRQDPEYLFWLEVKHGPCRMNSRELRRSASELTRIRGQDGAEALQAAKEEIARYVGRTIY